MKRYSGFRWGQFMIGVLLVILGIWTLGHPGMALTGVVMIYGLLAVLTGIMDIVFYVKMERYIGFGPMLSLISGILSVMAGVMLLVYPGAGSIAAAILFPLWFLAHCISRLAHLPHIRRAAGKGVYALTLIISVIGLILGFMMLLSPLFTLAAIRCFAGAYLILLGANGILLAFSPMGTGR